MDQTEGQKSGENRAKTGQGPGTDRDGERRQAQPGDNWKPVR